MTDEQIIQEYQAFVNSVNSGEKGEIAQGRFGDILDLIIRQKAENERLKKNIDGLNVFTTNHMKVIRLQAIKEFAERLKEIIYTHENRVDVDGIVLLTRIDNSIDNLVKEMTEVQE